MNCKSFAELCDAAADGLGVAFLPDHAVVANVALGRLMHVLLDWQGREGIAHLVFTTRRGLPPAVRALIHHLEKSIPTHGRDTCMTNALSARASQSWRPVLHPSDRRALPIAGDDASAKETVIDLLDSIGFDTLDAGPLSEGWRFEKDTPAYCVSKTLASLRVALDDAIRL